jgi:hypothetical protein
MMDGRRTGFVVKAGSRRRKIYGSHADGFREYFCGNLKLSGTHRHALDLACQMRE